MSFHFIHRESEFTHTFIPFNITRGTGDKARKAANRESASESVVIRIRAAGASGVERTSRTREREVRSQELLPRSRPAVGKTNLGGVSKSEGKS